MLASAADWTWPETVFVLGAMVVAFLFVFGAIATWLDVRKTRIAAHQNDDLRQLVHRYEQLAENTLDVHKRMAADVSDLRDRVGSVEQILRTVE
jgi:hypothetical protein